MNPHQPLEERLVAGPGGADGGRLVADQTPETDAVDKELSLGNYRRNMWYAHMLVHAGTLELQRDAWKAKAEQLEEELNRVFGRL